MDEKLTIADNLGRRLTKGIYFVTRSWRAIMLGYIFIISIGSTLLYCRDGLSPSSVFRSPLYLPSVPLHSIVTDQHHQRNNPRSELGVGAASSNAPSQRNAMILSLLFGVIGVDQFYAHHWPLAVFKLFTLGGVGVWAFVDMILWIAGGVYGTPGCPGGSSKGWQY